MATTQSYDARAWQTALDQQRRDRARYDTDPARATIDLLDAEDLAIARLARDRLDDRFPVRSPDVSYWGLSAGVRMSYLAEAVLERHPNPRGRPCGG